MKQYKNQKAGAEIVRTYDALLEKWGVSYQQRYVSTRYGDTHVVMCGAEGAPALVLFHGVGDDSALMWLYNAASLAARFRVYAVDTIGGPGKSRMGVGYDKSFDDAVWIDETLDGLGIDKASLVGVSHGGYLVQLYALSRPDRVNKAVCISSSVPSGGGSPMKTMMRVFLPEALFPTKRNVERLIRKLCGSSAEAFTRDTLVMEHYGWLLKGFNNMAMGYHRVRSFTEREIDSIRGKILYLVGERDPFQTLGGKQALLDHRMNVRFFPSAGHGLNHELAEQINAVLLEALSEG